MLKIVITSLITFTFFASGLYAQASGKPSGRSAAPSTAGTPAALAKNAVDAHGGSKLAEMRSLVVKGSVNLSVFGQSTPAAFSMAISGEKYSFEINNPFQPLKQVHDGTNTFSSIQGFSLPPITSLGFPLLPRAGVDGYVVSELPEDKRKRKGFRITTPEGFFTDFFINDKTGRIRSYESSYDVMGRIVTTSVEIDDFQTVDGVIVPSRYSQRFDLGNMTAYAAFRAREILINSAIEDSVFAVEK
ncbi:MAG: hypothetical protein IPM50_03915 [Acidobacteriota bacterium]|nr:MAG: hypothetical protein IPM50_03915 [Acidobacteriota bacterium]